MGGVISAWGGRVRFTKRPKGDGMRMQLLLALALALGGGAARADWALDPAGSHIGFASVKNGVIAENHHFTQLSGGVADDGQATVLISLASVETLLPIRNERMQTMLFEVADYPLAIVTAQVALDDLLALAPGQSLTRRLSITLDLHGRSAPKSLQAKVTRSAENQFEVASLGPVMVNSADFNLEAGVEALREVVGLESIDLMVPVTFALSFTSL